MYLDAATRSDKAKHIIAIDRITTFGQCKIYPLQSTVNDQHITVHIGTVLQLLIRTQIEVSGTTHRPLLCSPLQRVSLVTQLCLVPIYDIIDIQLLISNGLKEWVHLFESHLLDEMHGDGFIVVKFPVLQFPFKGFLSKGSLPAADFLKRLTYFGLCTRSCGYIQPTGLGCLIS